MSQKRIIPLMLVLMLAMLVVPKPVWGAGDFRAIKNNFPKAPKPKIMPEDNTWEGPYKLDAVNHFITVKPVGSMAANINSALNYLRLRTDKTILWTLRFLPGEYVLDTPLAVDKLSDVIITSIDNRLVTIRKSPSFSGDYLFVTRFSKNLSLHHFAFYGKTKEYDTNVALTNENHSQFHDNGVYFASTDGATVDKCAFHNFGHIALAVTTSPEDPKTGVDSFNTNVTNSVFENITQIASVSMSTVHGATATYRFAENTISKLHDGILFISNTPGAAHIRLQNNRVVDGGRDGFDVSGFSDIVIAGNQFENLKHIAIHVYTNRTAREGFAWGDNLLIKNNLISASGQGIQVDIGPYRDGYQAALGNMTIEGNTLTNITDLGALNQGPPAIGIANGTIEGLTVIDNRLNQIASGRYIVLSSDVRHRVVANNFMDNVALPVP